MLRADVLAQALSFGTPLVELTGGEPLLQPGVLSLMTELCNAGRTVLLETSGEADVSPVDPRVHKIMDLKCPGSGESHRNRWSNLAHLGPSDEIKFVLSDRADYEWMRATVRERRLTEQNREAPRERGLRQTRSEGPGRLGARGPAPRPRSTADAQVRLARRRNGRLAVSLAARSSAARGHKLAVRVHVLLRAEDERRAIVKPFGFDVENAIDSVGRGAACLLEEKRHGIRLVKQAKLALRTLACRAGTRRSPP